MHKARIARLHDGGHSHLDRSAHSAFVFDSVDFENRRLVEDYEARAGIAYVRALPLHWNTLIGNGNADGSVKVFADEDAGTDNLELDLSAAASSSGLELPLSVTERIGPTTSLLALRAIVDAFPDMCILPCIQSNGKVGIPVEVQAAAPKPSDAAILRERDARDIMENLAHCKLEGLSQGEQLSLLAFIQTFIALYSGPSAESLSLDSNGLQFLQTARMHSLMRRGTASVPFIYAMWAYHSDSQESLMQLLFPEAVTWEDLRMFLVPVWLRSDARLSDIFDRMARSAYARTKDPFSAVLAYTAIGKLSLLRAIFRLSPKHQKVHTFLENDFSQERWKKAASKNAFALLAQHKVEAACGFFILAGRSDQAIKTALMELKDPLLALALARLTAPKTQKFPPNVPSQVELSREAAQEFLAMKKSAISVSTGMQATTGGRTVGSNPNQQKKPASILGFGFDDDYDTAPIIPAPSAGDDDTTYYPPSVVNQSVAVPGPESSRGPATNLPSSYASDALDRPLMFVLENEFLSAAKGDKIPTLSGSQKADSDTAALYEYFAYSVLGQPLKGLESIMRRCAAGCMDVSLLRFALYLASGPACMGAMTCRVLVSKVEGSSTVSDVGDTLQKQKLVSVLRANTAAALLGQQLPLFALEIMATIPTDKPSEKYGSLLKSLDSSSSGEGDAKTAPELSLVLDVRRSVVRQCLIALMCDADVSLSHGLRFAQVMRLPGHICQSRSMDASLSEIIDIMVTNLRILTTATDLSGKKIMRPLEDMIAATAKLGTDSECWLAALSLVSAMPSSSGSKHESILQFASQAMLAGKEGVLGWLESQRRSLMMVVSSPRRMNNSFELAITLQNMACLLRYFAASSTASPPTSTGSPNVHCLLSTSSKVSLQEMADCLGFLGALQGVSAAMDTDSKRGLSLQDLISAMFCAQQSHQPQSVMIDLYRNQRDSGYRFPPLLKGVIYSLLHGMFNDFVAKHGIISLARGPDVIAALAAGNFQLFVEDKSSFETFNAQAKHLILRTPGDFLAVRQLQSMSGFLSLVSVLQEEDKSLSRADQKASPDDSCLSVGPKTCVFPPDAQPIWDLAYSSLHHKQDLNNVSKFFGTDEKGTVFVSKYGRAVLTLVLAADAEPILFAAVDGMTASTAARKSVLSLDLATGSPRSLIPSPLQPVIGSMVASVAQGVRWVKEQPLISKLQGQSAILRAKALGSKLKRERTSADTHGPASRAGITAISAVQAPSSAAATPSPIYRGDLLDTPRSLPRGFIYARDDQDFALPFSLPPFCISVNPKLSLYVRGGPLHSAGVAVCGFSVSASREGRSRQLSAAVVGVSCHHRLQAVLSYEPIQTNAMSAGEVRGIRTRMNETATVAAPVAGFIKPVTTIHQSDFSREDPSKMSDLASKVRWSPNGEFVASAHSSGVVRIWNESNSRNGIDPRARRVPELYSVSRRNAVSTTTEASNDKIEAAVYAATDLDWISYDGSVFAVGAAPIFDISPLNTVGTGKSDRGPNSGSGSSLAGLASQAQSSGRGGELSPRVDALFAQGLLSEPGFGVHLFDRRVGKSPIATANPCPENAGVTSMLYDRGTLSLVCGREDGSIVVYDIRRTRKASYVSAGPIVPSYLGSSSRNNAGSTMFTSGSSTIQNTANSAMAYARRPVRQPAWERGVSSCLAFDEALRSPGGLIDGTPAAVGHGGAVMSLAMHPRTPIVFSGGQDGHIKAWSVPDLRPVLLPWTGECNVHDGFDYRELLVNDNSIGFSVGPINITAVSNSGGISLTSSNSSTNLSSLANGSSGSLTPGGANGNSCNPSRLPRRPASPWTYGGGVTSLLCTEDMLLSGGYDGALYSFSLAYA